MASVGTNDADGDHSTPERATMTDRGPLVITGLEKSFGGVQALRGANLTCKPSEVHALIGENGAGKSTLVKVLSGALRADAGEIVLGGRTVRPESPRQAREAGIGTVFQELSLIPDLSVASNLFYGIEPNVRAGRIDRRALRRAAAAALDRFGVLQIKTDASVRDLALADRQILEVCKALLREPSVLILDEPTSALLPEQVDWLFAKVREFAAGGGIALFISHRLEEIESLSDHVTVLRGGVDVGSGPIAEMAEARLVELMLGRSVDRVFPEGSDDARSDEVVCEIGNLASPPRLKDVSLSIRKGEIVGVGGLQGQGQLPMFLALFGVIPSSGKVVVDGRTVRLRHPRAALDAGIALIPEDRASEGLCMTLSIRDNISLGSLSDLSSGGLVNPGRERRVLDSAVSKLRIVLKDVRQEVAALSGGNQQKVILARVLAQKPSLLLMYDATRGVDVGTKAEIYRLMREQCAAGNSILFYSTDAQELVNMADRVVVLHDGRIRAYLEGAEITESRIVAESVGGGARSQAR
jgi:ribose transport system ATP-binding protein